jgi:hypothetical protein
LKYLIEWSSACDLMCVRQWGSLHGLRGVQSGLELDAYYDEQQHANHYSDAKELLGGDAGRGRNLRRCVERSGHEWALLGILWSIHGVSCDSACLRITS